MAVLNVVGSVVTVTALQSNLAPGTFVTPAAAVKPRFRYWLPDCSIDADLMVDDIQQLKERNAGGIELHNYFGSPQGYPPTDWDTNGYGSPNYLALFKVAMQAALKNNISFDYAMSNNGAVPAEWNDPGLAWALKSSSATVNGTFNGTLPGWGKAKLLAAHTYAVTNVEQVNSHSTTPFGRRGSYTKSTISNHSLREVTSLVQMDGTVSITPTLLEGAKSYGLEAWYLYQPLGREIIANSHPKTFLGNGSLYTDHFSSTGAKVITDFLEKHIFIDGAMELIKKVGHYLWEDSVEIPANVYWTPGLENLFEKQHGYSIIPFLPLIQSIGGYQASSPGSRMVTDAATFNTGVVDDFLSTLNVGLKSYYDHLVNFTNSLGLKFSAQIGYNLPVDMLRAVPLADAPETETLSFGNNIDGFLQYSGPADLSGKEIISIELGADYELSFSQTWSRLLHDAKRAFVGGVNQVIIHGATYSYNFTGTTWPGYTTHGYDYPEHSRHQPGWDVGYAEALAYLGRVQWVLQSGTPKVDVVLWDKQCPQNAFPSTLYIPSDLQAAGYTHEYLSPDNFALKEAYVHNSILAPRAQAFKALVIRGNDTLTPEGIRYLTNYAEAGLPVIISGDLTYRYDTADETAIKGANETLKSFIGANNVHQVPYENLASSIASIGIAPRSRIDANGTWYTRWRELSNGDIYVLIYNEGDYSTGSITFQATGSAYFLDAWTGGESRIGVYTRDDDNITIPMALQTLETAIIKLNSSEPLNTHVTSHTASVLGFQIDDHSVIGAKAAYSNSSSIVLSSGRTVDLDVSKIDLAYTMKDWKLVVEQWVPPDDPYDLDFDAKKLNTTIDISGGVLSSWSDLGLTNMSGIGFYNAEFEWYLDNDTKLVNGAFLSLPAIDQGVTGSLNGKSLPTLDITNPRVDLSSFLVVGTNSLTLKVSSTLWNSARAYWDQIKTAGKGPSHDLSVFPEMQAYGIVGEVVIVPYVLFNIN
ncbi:hypothetical protein BKA67DRAFT_542618 [Truncatella angustata]|uniref:Secreted protein n=1 Tax=Truncatella angustata TaxID=152316 RepID=A0A9P8RIB5_9PEZI|nr:uncharacterized protein BKA67DRAFT_542618 [Truncatella angustata]KAH6640096.1 hypothetical protein BKA67DRAFT_542618 [Truncatella angustata]